jgi:hypothetical protein
MRIAVLLNQRHARLRTAAKAFLGRAYGTMAGGPTGAFLLPDYDSFGSLGDKPAVIFGTGDSIPWDRLRECDLLLWEWGWTASAAEVVVEIHARQPLPTMVFPGPVDRFWTELDWQTLPVHRAAARLTTGVGVMSRDLIGFYEALLPWAQVRHLPVPTDVTFLSAFASDALRDPNLLLLTAPSRFTGSDTNLAIATLAAFRQLRLRRPAVRGMCFAYSDEEARITEAVLTNLDLRECVEVERFIRPVQRYLERIARCGAGLFLPRGDIQGRIAMIAAATGLPMVVSDDVDAHRVLFPHSSVRWSDATAAMETCLRVMDDADFRAAVRSTAAAAVQQFDVDSCRHRLEQLAAAMGVRLLPAGEPVCVQ